MSSGFPWKRNPHIKKSLACFIADYSTRRGLKSRSMLFRERNKIASEFMMFAKKHHYAVFLDSRFTLSCVSMQIAWATTPQKDAKLIKTHPSGYRMKSEYNILMQLQGVSLIP